MNGSARRLGEFLGSIGGTSGAALRYGTVVGTGNSPLLTVSIAGEQIDLPCLSTCVDAVAGDRCLIASYGSLSTVIGIIATALDPVQSVVLTPADGWSIYSDAQPPTLFRVGRLVATAGAFMNANDVTPGSSGVTMGTIPEGWRPRQAVRIIAQGTGVRRYLCVFNASGTVVAARYGVDSYETASSGSWFNIGGTAWYTD